MILSPSHRSAAVGLAIFITSVLCTPAIPHEQHFLSTQDQDVKSLPKKGDKVHGQNPASYCSDPSTDIYQISNLAFYPINPTLNYYLTIKFFGTFNSPTGPDPWLNITGTLPSDASPRELFSNPLCDIDVFQEIEVGGREGKYMHRACPPGIGVGYAVVSSPPVPLSSGYGFEKGRYDLRAEAKTQDGRSIFCVEGSFVM